MHFSGCGMPQCYGTAITATGHRCGTCGLDADQAYHLLGVMQNLHQIIIKSLFDADFDVAGTDAKKLICAGLQFKSLQPVPLLPAV